MMSKHISRSDDWANGDPSRISGVGQGVGFTPEQRTIVYMDFDMQ